MTYTSIISALKKTPKTEKKKKKKKKISSRTFELNHSLFSIEKERLPCFILLSSILKIHSKVAFCALPPFSLKARLRDCVIILIFHGVQPTLSIIPPFLSSLYSFSFSVFHLIFSPTLLKQTTLLVSDSILFHRFVFCFLLLPLFYRYLLLFLA